VVAIKIKPRVFMTPCIECPRNRRGPGTFRRLALSYWRSFAFTQGAGKELERTAPYILKRGSRLIDLAEHIHHDFLAHSSMLDCGEKGDSKARW